MIMNLCTNNGIQVVGLVNFRYYIISGICFCMLVTPIFRAFCLPICANRHAKVHKVGYVEFCFTALTINDGSSVTVFMFAIYSFRIPIVFFTSPGKRKHPMGAQSLPISFTVKCRIFRLLFVGIVPGKIRCRVCLSIFVVGSN